MTWYYETGGQQKGPVSDSELDNLLASKVITLDTLVWREGQAGWAPVRAVRPPGGAPPPSAAPGGVMLSKPAEAGGGAGGSDVPLPGYVRCTATGKYFPPSEIIYIEGNPYSAAAKPQVVASLQGGGMLPSVEDHGMRNGPAWEQRQSLGFVKAMVDTTKAVLLDPMNTFARMKREGGMWEPLLYFIIVGTVCGAINQLFSAVFSISLPMMFMPQGGNAAATAGTAAAGAGVQMVCAMVAMPFLIALGAFVGGGLIHLCLMMLSAARQPYETSFRAYCYASGAAAAFQIIPIIGPIINFFWGIVTTCIAMAKAHEIPTGKAVIAVLLPMIVCCVLAGALAFVLIGGMTAAAASGAAGGSPGGFGTP